MQVETFQKRPSSILAPFLMKSIQKLSIYRVALDEGILPFSVCPFLFFALFFAIKLLSEKLKPRRAGFCIIPRRVDVYLFFIKALYGVIPAF